LRAGIRNYVTEQVGGGPEAIAEWKLLVQALSRAGQNVFAKVGGAGMPGCGFGWAASPRPPSSQEVAEATLGYYGHVIDCFGAERCMFESEPCLSVGRGVFVSWAGRVCQLGCAHGNNSRPTDAKHAPPN
jgi:hypothetical protein